MPLFIAPEIETDPDALAQEGLDYLESAIPGYESHEGNLEVIVVESGARMTAVRRDVDAQIPTTIFRYFGASVAGIIPIDAAPASVDSTWTVQDDSGYTIPAGTAVAVPATGDEYAAFETLEDVVVPPGETATAAGEVALVASVAGAAASGLSGVPQLVDTLAFVESIALVGDTSGGVDAETDAAFLDRLVAQLRLMSPRPIVPDDFAVLARSIPGVYRATAIDLYNPADQTYNNERMVTVAVVDENGEPVSALVKAAVDSLLQSMREATFVAHVVDPTYELIDVTFTAKAYARATPADVEARAEQAIRDYLDPSAWGLVAAGEEPPWINQTTLRRFELVAVLEGVDGLDYVQTLTLAKDGQALGTADVALTGAAPLPRPETINGTVSAP